MVDNTIYNKLDRPSCMPLFMSLLLCGLGSGNSITKKEPTSGDR